MKIFSGLLLILICAYPAHGYLNIKYNQDVPGVSGKSTKLQCEIESDKAIKMVKWYYIANEEAPETTVYYYQPGPPKYDMANGAYYQGRASLDKDGSSLILNGLTTDDEGKYRCYIEVETRVENGTNTAEIPEEKSVSMALTIYVAPSDAKLTSFLAKDLLTFSCRSFSSKPAAVISWELTNKEKSEKRELKSSKIISEFADDSELLIDTVGYLYYTVGMDDVNTTFTCVVEHPQTDTVLTKSNQLIAPALRHPVMMEFDMIGSDVTVPYSDYLANMPAENETTTHVGIVNMGIEPGTVVAPNATVVIGITADGVFPQPTFSWWSDDMDSFGHLRNERILNIPALASSQKIFCLIENPVGRVVIAVDVTVQEGGLTIDGKNGSGRTGDPESYMISGALVAAVAFGTLVVLFLIGFVIYYFACKKQIDKDAEKLQGGNKGDDFDPYMQKIPPFKEPSEEEYKEINENRDDDIIKTKLPEEETLLKAAPPSDNIYGKMQPEGEVPTKTNMESSATSTSGYSDGGRHSMAHSSVHNSSGNHSNSGDSERGRAMSRHLRDFDENASFVGEYGSTFGLERDPDEIVEAEASRSPFDETADDDDRSDAASIESGDSAIEAKYRVNSSHDSSFSGKTTDDGKTLQTAV